MGLFWGKQNDEMDVKASDDVRNQNTASRSSVNDPREKQVKRTVHARGYIDETLGLEETLAAAGLPACSYSHISLNEPNQIEPSETHSSEESDIVTEVYCFPVPDEYRSSVYPHSLSNSSFRDRPHEPYSFKGQGDEACVNDADWNCSESSGVQGSQTHVKDINYNDIQNCTDHIDRSSQNSRIHNVETHGIDLDFNNSYDSRLQSNVVRANELNFNSSHIHSDQDVQQSAIAINHNENRKRSHEDSHSSPHRPETTCEESFVSSQQCMSKTYNDGERPRSDTETSDEPRGAGVVPGSRSYQPFDTTPFRSEIWTRKEPSRCVVRMPIRKDYLKPKTNDNLIRFSGPTDLERNVSVSVDGSRPCGDFDSYGIPTSHVSTTVDCHVLPSRIMSSIADNTHQEHDENRSETRLCCPVPDQRFRAAARESSPITENNFHQRLRVAMEMCGVQPLIPDSSPSNVSRKRSSEDQSETIARPKRPRANFDSRHTGDQSAKEKTRLAPPIIKYPECYEVRRGE